jgi:hypothetical protein
MTSSHLPTTHHSTPGPLSLPHDILLARNVLVCCSVYQPNPPPIYNGPHLVLERSHCFFKLHVRNRQDTISTLCLKLCHIPPDIVVTKPSCHFHPPSVDDNIFVANNFATAACFPCCIMFRCPLHCKEDLCIPRNDTAQSSSQFLFIFP